jgi:hypothetical protein
MSARQALATSAKKATDASREQVYAYVGANDYWYQQLRRQPAALQELSDKVSQLSEVRLAALRSTVSSYAPRNVVGIVQEQVKAARDRRADLAARGEAIAQDWYTSVAAQDASAFASAIREAKNPIELAKSVRSWYFEPTTPASKPAAEATSAQPKASPRKAAPAK